VTIEGILGAIVIGLILGALGRLVVPGKQDIPIWLTILVGIAPPSSAARSSDPCATPTGSTG
jgi:uncharacterized membrane protein YeaQ/YmgE (transglycosylase-associated protein family)